MKPRVFLLSLGFVLFEVFFIHASSDLTFKILTWNTGFVYLGPLYKKVAKDPIEPAFESRTPDKYLPHIAEIISRLQPDFIALQEMRDELQAKKLSDLLKGHYDFLALKGNRDRAAVIFWRKTFSIVKLSKIVIPGAREFPLIEVALDDNKIFALSSIHLAAFNVTRRDKQVDFLKNWLEKNARELIVLAGDFNFRPDSPVYRQLTSVIRDLTRDVSTSTIWGPKVDYVFLKNSDTSVLRTQTQVISGANLPLMDHLPLLVTVALSAN